MSNQSMSEIIETYGRDILRFCRFATGSLEDGDELYQDTMVYLMEHPKLLADPEKIRSNACAAAGFLWKSRRRKAARRMRVTSMGSLEAWQEAGMDIAAPGDETPEEAAIRREEIETLLRLISGLPDRYRLPLIMYYSANMKEKEIAAALGISDTAVRTRMHRAKEKLRKEMSAHG